MAAYVRQMFFCAAFKANLIFLVKIQKHADNFPPDIWHVLFKTSFIRTGLKFFIRPENIQAKETFVTVHFHKNITKICKYNTAVQTTLRIERYNSS